ncbi:hypothetical protein AVEN_131855-1 [Araneus ventricosus]|uniref:CCHC-type domain-containing protein n=1 Tax=Araneus ventricosus TaxID=182803 RepID=A0A4Y2PLU2_ARAVE|nr:hypothetical protein AVEN_131855-1 [Araneus ventricosus]
MPRKNSKNSAKHINSARQSRDSVNEDTQNSVNRVLNSSQPYSNISSTYQNTIKGKGVSFKQMSQQKPPRSTLISDRFHSKSNETLNKLPKAQCNTSNPVLKNQRKTLTPLDPILLTAIQNKIEQVEEQRFERYSKIREQSPNTYETIKENICNFAGGILMSEIANSFGDDAPSILASLNKSSFSISSTPKNASRPLHSTPNQLELKENLRIKTPPDLSRTPSPVLNTSSIHLDQQTPPPLDNGLPIVTTPVFLPDTSDIDGAILEMSPLPIQDMDNEEDLEVLFSRIKGTTDTQHSQQDHSAPSSYPDKENCSFYARIEKIKDFLSSSTPDVNQAILYLDQLQADLFTNELIQIKPHKDAPQSSIQAKASVSQVSLSYPSSNQVPSSTSSKHTILLYPNSKSNSNLTDILNEELQPQDFHPTNIRPIKGKGLAISLNSSKDLDNFQLKISDNENLKSHIKVKFPEKRLPSLIVYNIPSTINEESVQEAMMAQLNLPIPLKIRFKFKGNSPETTNWVFESTSSIIKTAQKLKKLTIGWSFLKISEFFHIKRCNFCQAYGHTTKDCNYHLPSCGSCADHHATRDCSSTYICCINCYESNLHTGTQYPTFHPAKDQCCPFFQAAKQQYCSTREYT